MTIPISDVIRVDIAVAPLSVGTDGFGPLLFLSSEFKSIPGQNSRYLSFGSLKEVESVYPSGEVHKAAIAYYAQTPKPRTFIVGALTGQGTPATSGKLTASIAGDLAAAKTANSLQFALDGSVVSLAGVDLSTTTTASSVVTALNAALGLQNVGAVVSQTAGVFSITSNTTGTSSSVGVATGSIGTALKLDFASNPIQVDGVAATGITQDLAKVGDSNLNFYFVSVERAKRATPDQIEVAKWSEANGKVFGWADKDPKILLTNTQNSFATAKSLNLRRTITVFDASENGDEYPEVSILARAATVNFNVANSSLVLAFKKGPTITTANLTTGQLAALRSYNGNAFIDVGNNTIFLDGKMSSGDVWFDTIQGVDWLTQKVQVNVFNLFYQAETKVPWTDVGVAMVEHQVTLALELARTNGLIAPGYDNEGVFYPTGYKVTSTNLELLQSQKGARQWEGTSFIAIGAGALQGATINGNFIQ